MHAKRIIPCLDVKNGRVVKGTSFVNLRDAGDPEKRRSPTTGKARMNWCCWISPPPPMPEALCWISSAEWLKKSLFPLP